MNTTDAPSEQMFLVPGALLAGVINHLETRSEVALLIASLKMSRLAPSVALQVQPEAAASDAPATEEKMSTPQVAGCEAILDG